MSTKRSTEQGYLRSPPAREEQHTAGDNESERDHNHQYYEQYRRLYHTAFLLSHQLRQLAENKDELWQKVVRFQKKTQEFKDDIRGEPPERKKRFRRTAQEIDRSYECEVERCRKCYGSEGSLQQHIKLKHPQLYESRSQHKKESVESHNNHYSNQFD